MLYCLRAAITPNSVPNTVDRTSAVTVSSRVGIRRFPTTVSTGSPEWYENPKLPVRSWPNHIAYRTGNGLLSPRRSRIFS